MRSVGSAKNVPRLYYHVCDGPGTAMLESPDQAAEILRLDTRDRFLEQTILYHPHEREFGLGSCLYAPVVL